MLPSGIERRDETGDQAHDDPDPKQRRNIAAPLLDAPSE